MKEPTLGNPQNTIEVLQKYNFSFQKKFGQNFLIDTHVLDKIIQGLTVIKNEICINRTLYSTAGTYLWHFSPSVRLLLHT